MKKLFKNLYYRIFGIRCPDFSMFDKNLKRIMQGVSKPLVEERRKELGL